MVQALQIMFSLISQLFAVRIALQTIGMVESPMDVLDLKIELEIFSCVLPFS